MPTTVYIAGQVFAEGAPKTANIDVFETVSKVFVKTVASNSFGQFMIDGLNSTKRYDLVAIDPSGTWEKRISSNHLPLVFTSP